MKFRTLKDKNSILIGSLLGDGTISKDGRFRIFHSIKQKEYVDFKAELLKNFFPVTPGERKCTIKGKEFTQVGFSSKTSLYLKRLRKTFYSPNKKITMIQLKKLTPLGLALWYMDDGSLIFQKNNDGKIESRKAYINTQNFSFEENQLMVLYFKEEFDINCKIHKDKTYYRLYFNSSEIKKLIGIIEPYIIDSMRYKICMKYGKNKAKENVCKKACSNECKYNLL